MAELNNVRDGRKAKVYLLEHATTAATTLALGKIYCITGIGSTTIFGNPGNAAARRHGRLFHIA